VLGRREYSRAAVIVGVAVALLVVSGCGTRTGLAVDPCDGGVRECTTSCGVGEQACVGGEWARCVVETRTGPCTGVCGEGVQVCDGEEGWGPCEVAPTEVPCRNACGEGTASCEDETVGECLVPPVEEACTTPCGEGVRICVDGAFTRCFGADVLPPLLDVRVRDFRASHPDFENVIGDDRGIVAPILGSDDKPVYAGPTPTTHGRARFDEWYRDVPGVNQGVDIELTLRGTGGDPELYVFSDPTFFPIDGRLFGNEGREHNFHFTLEANRPARGDHRLRLPGRRDVPVSGGR